MFKKYKKASHVLMIGAGASLFAWGYFSGKDLIDGDYSTVAGAYFKPKNVAFLGAYGLFYSASIYFNLNGDKRLVKSIDRHNKIIRRK